MTSAQTHPAGTTTAKMITNQEGEILTAWVSTQLEAITRRADLIGADELRRESQQFLAAFAQAIATEAWEDIQAPGFKTLRQALAALSRSRAAQGFSPSETATFVFSLKDTLLAFLQDNLGSQPEALNREVIALSHLLDKLGLYTFEIFSREREDLLAAQLEAITEMASPALRVWDDIVLLPLVGTIDTQRAQIILDSLLNAIAETEALVAILDITGVPVIDTRVAQHLLTAVQGSHMLGAQTIITGVSVETAKTLTKLQITLGEVVTRGTLRSGLRYAFQLVGVRLSTETAA